MWSVHTTEYYSVIKRNEALTQATTWMKLEDIMLSERSLRQRTTYCIIHSTDAKCLEEANQLRKKIN